MTSETISQLAFDLEKKFSLSNVQQENLLTLLIDFWHAVLNLAVEFEKQAISLAQKYEKENISTVPAWQRPCFAKHLQVLHQNKYGKFYESIDSVPLDDAWLLMPFLVTMRLEPWFDKKMFNVNCSLQLMIYFERNYIVESRRLKKNDELLQYTPGLELMMRKVWNVILSSHSMIYNNAFAFCLNSLLPKKRSHGKIIILVKFLQLPAQFCTQKN